MQHFIDFYRIFRFSSLSDVSPIGLGILSFCKHSNLRCLFLMPFWQSATRVDVKQHKKCWPIIPEKYKNKYSISLILTVFEVFLV